MNTLLARYELAQTESFKARCLIAALSLAQFVLNDKKADQKLKVVCQSIVNNPGGSKDTLALNVAALTFDDPDDNRLIDLVRDVVTGMAGITEE